MKLKLKTMLLSINICLPPVTYLHTQFTHVTFTLQTKTESSSIILPQLLSEGNIGDALLPQVNHKLKHLSDDIF